MPTCTLMMMLWNGKQQQGTSVWCAQCCSSYALLQDEDRRGSSSGMNVGIQS